MCRPSGRSVEGHRARLVVHRAEHVREHGRTPVGAGRATVPPQADRAVVEPLEGADPVVPAGRHRAHREVQVRTGVAGSRGRDVEVAARRVQIDVVVEPAVEPVDVLLEEPVAGVDVVVEPAVEPVDVLFEVVDVVLVDEPVVEPVVVPGVVLTTALPEITSKASTWTQ